MYYFLAIVKQKDMKNGNIIPSYILCKDSGTSENRAPWRIIQPGSQVSHLPKVLVTSLIGNETMIDFMSAYRTRDKNYMTHRKGKATQKYYPEGALFWFPCDIYGNIKGAALYIKHVPDPELKKLGADQGFARYKEAIAKRPRTSEKFIKDKHMYDLKDSNVKPKLRQ